MLPEADCVAPNAEESAAELVVQPAAEADVEVAFEPAVASFAENSRLDLAQMMLTMVRNSGMEATIVEVAQKSQRLVNYNGLVLCGQPSRLCSVVAVQLGVVGPD
jgi:sRNA-binding protein